MKLILFLLLLPMICFGQSQFKDTGDPGAWTFTTKYRTDSTKLRLNGHGQVRDTLTVIIRCNPPQHVITFNYVDSYMQGESLTIPYGFVEDYRADPRYLRGSFYYHTAGYGDVEFHPNEMVVINDPLAGTRIEFLK